MKLGPGQYETNLFDAEISTDHLDLVNGDDAARILMIRVKVWPVMTFSCFDVHSNHNPEKPADFRHSHESVTAGDLPLTGTDIMDLSRSFFR